MEFQILGDVDKDRFYCAGSFTKVMTTFVCLSFLSEKYELKNILDNDYFFDSVSKTPSAREFLTIMHHIIGSHFSIRDICTFYDGLPYTFDLPAAELENVDAGKLFKHHSVMDEKVFLEICRNCITQVDPNRCKFHYSELSIILLGYLIEQIYGVTMESLYQKYVIDAFSLRHSVFSRTRPDNVYYQDLSVRYDYPCVALMDHGFFCYGNGYFTTLNEQKKLLQQMLLTPVFEVMSDLTHARIAISTHIMNGLTVELHLAGDDLVVGYDGMSYSGCNAWAYSKKQGKGYLTFADDHDPAYQLIHGAIGYEDYDEAPLHAKQIYQDFLKTRHYEFEKKALPAEYIGSYQRVQMNDSMLDTVFTVGEHHIEIRNPTLVKYDVLYDHGVYRIACQDYMHGSKVGFYQARSGRRYMLFDGMLYRKM